MKIIYVEKYVAQIVLKFCDSKPKIENFTKQRVTAKLTIFSIISRIRFVQNRS